MVWVGESGWARRARVADILLADADRLNSAERLRVDLFGRHPGLSLVALALPDGVAVFGHHRRLPGQWPATAEAAARAIYLCG